MLEDAVCQEDCRPLKQEVLWAWSQELRWRAAAAHYWGNPC